MGVVFGLEEAGHEDKQQMYFANTVEWRLVDTSVTPPSLLVLSQGEKSVMKLVARWRRLVELVR